MISKPPISLSLNPVRLHCASYAFCCGTQSSVVPPVRTTRICHFFYHSAVSRHFLKTLFSLLRLHYRNFHSELNNISHTRNNSTNVPVPFVLSTSVNDEIRSRRVEQRQHTCFCHMVLLSPYRHNPGRQFHDPQTSFTIILTSAVDMSKNNVITYYIGRKWTCYAYY